MTDCPKPGPNDKEKGQGDKGKYTSKPSSKSSSSYEKKKKFFKAPYYSTLDLDGMLKVSPKRNLKRREEKAQLNFRAVEITQIVESEAAHETADHSESSSSALDSSSDHEDDEMFNSIEARIFLF